MKEETKSLYMAIIASILIIFGVNHFFPAEKSLQLNNEDVKVPDVVKVEQPEIVVENKLSAKEVLSSQANIEIINSDIKGSIRVKGARFDYLTLSKYKQTLEQDSQDVELLQPSETSSSYFAEFGWLSADPNVKLPNSETLWTVVGDKLTPQTPVTLEWNNGEGLRFIKTISVDDNYLLKTTLKIRLFYIHMV